VDVVDNKRNNTTFRIT